MNETVKKIAALRNVAALLTLVDQVQNRTYGLPGLAVYCGHSGWGKTSAATYCTNKYRACHIEMKVLWRPKTVLHKIVFELGLRPETSGPRLFDQAAEELARTGRTLILDEADYLAKDYMIEVIRDLHDASNAAVILIGEELLPEKLRRWERVYGRVLKWVKAEPACMADLVTLAPIYAPGIEITEALRARVLSVSHQSLRRLSSNLTEVYSESLLKGLRRMDIDDAANIEWFTGATPPIRRAEVPAKAAAAAPGPRRAPVAPASVRAVK